MPVLHSSAALLKLSLMRYTGAQSIFMRVPPNPALPARRRDLPCGSLPVPPISPAPPRPALPRPPRRSHVLRGPGLLRRWGGVVQELLDKKYALPYR